jgi:hypothetical protein
MTLDRSAIMRDAWSRYRASQRLGLGFDFARCVRQAWFAAKHKQMFPRQHYNPEAYIVPQQWAVAV